MRNVLFCNNGWQRNYRGLSHDPIFNGGTNENYYHECANFERTPEGFYFGHVETFREDLQKDFQLKLENFDVHPSAMSIKNIFVIHTATPNGGGNAIVGAYKDCEVFRHRQYHKFYPTNVHSKNRVDSYRLRSKKAHLIPTDERDFIVPRGQKNWPGHFPVFYANLHINMNPSLHAFLKDAFSYFDEAFAL